MNDIIVFPFQGDHGCPIFGETKQIIGIVTHITGVGKTPIVFDKVDKVAKHIDNWMHHLLIKQNNCAPQSSNFVLRYFIK